MKGSTAAHAKLVHDILAALAPHGHLVALEVKTGRAKLTAEQRHVHAGLRAVGCARRDGSQRGRCAGGARRGGRSAVAMSSAPILDAGSRTLAPAFRDHAGRWHSEGRRALAALAEKEAVIASICDVSASAVSQWLSGRTRPDREQATRLELRLGVRVVLWELAPWTNVSAAKPENVDGDNAA